ncbi:ABC transporter substrate-binding protein [Thiorhodococcus minor]|nr:ABC transporter substrate-binding protein [Thiorhodococcus minor]
MLAPPAQAAETVRMAVLQMGTVAWEADVAKHHGFDTAEGIELIAKPYAGTQATMVALQGGDADVSVTDWIWVSRQRNEGRPYSFVPYSTSIGELMVPAGSGIASLADLEAKRLGIAGGALDKNWLLLRALARKELDIDLARRVDPLYGAPPLLNAQIEQGRLDGVITYWPFAARLSAKGYRSLIGAEEAVKRLGIEVKVPMIGYVFDEDWAKANPEAIRGYLRAVHKAKALLAESNAEWERIRPLMGVKDDATFVALREGYRAGIPRQWGDAERAGAAELFEILREMGGEKLVGKASRLAAGTFWDAQTD